MVAAMFGNRFVIVKLPRQAGKTSIVSAVLLWHVLFNKNYSILIAAHLRDKALDVLSSIKQMYENLPDFLQNGVKEWNKGNIIIENNSRIRCSATTASSARGDVYNMVYLDEFAFVASHIAEEFVKSVMPTISSGQTTKTFITSTPKGLNMFHSMWKAAVQRKSEYVPIEIKWDDVPGRDEKFRKGIIAQFGEDYFNQEYGAEFIGSSRTLIKAAKLLALAPDVPIYQNEHLRVYEHPEKGKTYAITVDVAEGLGGDCSIVDVIDITCLPYRQVAVYQDRTIDTMAFPGVIFDLGRAYNGAMVLVESNFGSEVGKTLMHDLEYENVVMTTRKVKDSGQSVSGGFAGTARVGLALDVKSKRIGCTNLKSLVENDQLIVVDEGTILELQRFVVMKKSYAAEEGNDDLAMTLVLFGWLVDQGYVKDATDVNAREKIAAMHQKRIEESLLPFGYVRDGHDPLEGQVVAVDKKSERNWLFPDGDEPKIPGLISSY